MPARLDPAERDRRAKERRQQQWARMKSGAAYKQFNPNDGVGHGSESQWRDAADERLYGRGLPKPDIDADLALLGLSEMPDAKQLTRAYRLASRSAHPDTDGGSTEKFTALKDAYDRLMEKV